MLSILHLGLGEIGKSTIRALLAQSRLVRLAAVVDIHPAFAGKTLRAVMPDTAGVPSLGVTGSLKEAIASLKGKPAVATMTTGSRTEDVRATLEMLIAAGIHVVSTCEELAFPALRAAKIAAALDKQAKKRGVVLLGTGVNPGFAMDAFALACTAPCTCVRHIKVIRSLDASTRRQQLQKKVGAGMTPAAVKKLIKTRSIGHVGLGESCAMIAAGLGWKLESIREKFEPVVADHLVSSQFFTVRPGEVRGMRMTADGFVRTPAGPKKLIELDLLMALDADTFDEVIIDGDPALLIRTKSGFPGDSCTAGIVANCARLAPALAPGLRTMLDVFQARSIGA